MGQRIYCSPSKTSIGENIKMNKQELIDEINKTKEHLENMKKKLEECEYERWKPRNGKYFWYVDTALRIQTEPYNGFNIDELRFNTYNCFETKAEAEAEAEKILVRRMLEDIARRLNKGQVINWNNFAQSKYFLGIDYDKYLAMGVALSCCKNIRTQGTIYCLDRNFKNVAIQEIGEERLKKYLRGE